MKSILWWFSFTGRASRRHFLTIVAINIVVYALLKIYPNAFNKMSLPWLCVAVILSLLEIWVSLATQCKRWHDLGKSAWWLLLTLVPLIGPIWIVGECGSHPGSEGENKYGAPVSRAANITPDPATP